MRYFTLLILFLSSLVSFGQITINENIVNASCNGLCDASISLFPSGGVSPYSYLWSNGDTNSSAYNLCAGVYTVVVTDSTGSNVSDTLVISSPTAITANVITEDDTCGMCVGSATITPSGGTPPYSYAWSPMGMTTPQAIGLCGGVYQCTITDMNGCFQVFNAVVNYTPGSPCGFGEIYGSVYNDLNANCNRDTLEEGFQNIMLMATPGPYYASTNVNGEYLFVMPYASYTISQVLPQYYNEICPVSGSYGVTLDSLNSTVTNIDFADTITSVQDVSISLFSGTARPGFTLYYYINYSSISASTMNGTISLVVDDTLSFLGASIPPNLISGDTLFWNYSNLQQLQHRSINVTFQVPADVNLLGDTLHACAEITPLVGDVDVSNNTSCYDRVIVGSYDPNDKQVMPEGDILLSDTKLTYTIRFQNSGTDTAFNVVVIDTLSANLDITSIRNITASHPFSYDVSGQGVLTFTFDNILLPDSNVNEPASHGLIQFEIDQHPSNTIGTTIENTAEIYFDFNPPIVTNTVSNTIVTLTSVGENNVVNKINIYPNPANEQFTIDFNVQEVNEVSIALYDLLGNKVSQFMQQKKVQGSYQMNWNVSDVNSGIYFVAIKIGEQTYLNKVVIQ